MSTPSDAKKSWASFVQDENAKTREALGAISREDQEAALFLLSTLGFTEAHFQELSHGAEISIFDHRIQLLIYDALRYRRIKAAAIRAAENLPCEAQERKWLN
ncbi:MAG TPA: hypothetical protein VFX37_15185 [Pseudolabrys sp.]|nr:hypothetical protein [Pseudolabrys sp.]